MTNGFVFNYKSKKIELERLISNLEDLGLDVSKYQQNLNEIVASCTKEVEEIQNKPKSAFTAAYLDSAYSRGFKSLQALSLELNKYNKLLKLYENVQIYKEAAEEESILEENIAVYANNAIRSIIDLLACCDFADPNCEIILKKILPFYVIIIQKELLFHGNSVLLEFIEESGLSEIFRSAININLQDLKNKPSSLAGVIESDDNFINDVSKKLHEQYEKICAKIDKKKELAAAIDNKQSEKNATNKRRNDAKVTRLIASATATVVLLSGLIYGANKGVKALSSTKLYHTTKETYSTVDGLTRTTADYQEKIPAGEKILVVSYTPWEEFMTNNYTRTVVSADVSDIDYEKLEEYVALNLADLNNVNITNENSTNLSAKETYEQQITEVIHLIQNSNNYIVDSDNLAYRYSLLIVLLMLFVPWAIVKMSFLFAGITDLSLIDVKEIMRRLKIRKDCDKVLEELDKDISNLIAEYDANNKDLENLLYNFKHIYVKYRFLIEDPKVLDTYDTLIRKKGI